jgi:5-methylcytosine-specific restriction enzyme A
MKRKLTMLTPRINAQHRSLSRVPKVMQTERVTGRKLQRMRRAMQLDNPLCRCSTDNHPVAATERDHIIPLWKGGRDDESNTQLLCDACHLEKTTAENKERYGQR